MKSSSVFGPAFAATRMVNPGIEPRDIDASLLNLFEWQSQYAAAGYCNADSADGAAISCEDDVCADLVTNGAIVSSTFSGDWASTGGVLILDDTNKAIVVSFAGTEKGSLVDYVIDSDIDLDDIDMCDGCQVHSGFLTAWESVSAGVLEQVSTLIAEKGSTYSISFTGHSLGAALATLGCAQWRINGGSCELYTFGSPRVGNMEFVEFVSAQAGNEYRMTHIDDPVPRLPGHALGYYHTDVEYWLSTGEYDTTDYAASDVVICTGYYNTSCNSQGIISLDYKAHSYYLRHISVCS